MTTKKALETIRDVLDPMTEQEINTEVAKVCGWSCDPITNVPNYYRDLNAMQEAEQTLSGNDLINYREELCYVCASSRYGDAIHCRAINAEAWERATAFVRVIRRKK
jgi:hypothetical protein